MRRSYLDESISRRSRASSVRAPNQCTRQVEHAREPDTAYVAFLEEAAQRVTLLQSALDGVSCVLRGRAHCHRQRCSRSESEQEATRGRIQEVVQTIRLVQDFAESSYSEASETVTALARRMGDAEERVQRVSSFSNVVSNLPQLSSVQAGAMEEIAANRSKSLEASTRVSPCLCATLQLDTLTSGLADVQAT